MSVNNIIYLPYSYIMSSCVLVQFTSDSFRSKIIIYLQMEMHGCSYSVNSCISSRHEWQRYLYS